jgi:hypothetical protein
VALTAKRAQRPRSGLSLNQSWRWSMMWKPPSAAEATTETGESAVSHAPSSNQKTPPSAQQVDARQMVVSPPPRP